MGALHLYNKGFPLRPSKTNRSNPSLPKISVNGLDLFHPNDKGIRVT